jgi:hypothetical protein
MIITSNALHDLTRGHGCFRRRHLVPAATKPPPADKGHKHRCHHETPLSEPQRVESASWALRERQLNLPFGEPLGSSTPATRRFIRARQNIPGIWIWETGAASVGRDCPPSGRREEIEPPSDYLPISAQDGLIGPSFFRRPE